MLCPQRSYPHRRQRRGEPIVITVEDEGQGITPEHLNRIFDPFSARRGERAMGLGLSIASAAMARINRAISALNRQQAEAKFTLSFPMPHTKPIGEEQHNSTKIPSCRTSVSVTDDDLDNLQSLCAFLQSKGHSVIWASSSPETLKILWRRSHRRRWSPVISECGWSAAGRSHR
jgi:Histidine kinase-, DNA gyrase B-, and HSP90-like ATPase